MVSSGHHRICTFKARESTKLIVTGDCAFDDYQLYSYAAEVTHENEVVTQTWTRSR